MTRSLFNEDEWFVLWSFKDGFDERWEADGPFKSRLTAEREADDYSPDLYKVRVVHSVFTY